MNRVLTLLAVLALAGAALLIWLGETDESLWASYDTINGSPSLEVRP